MEEVGYPPNPWYGAAALVWIKKKIFLIFPSLPTLHPSGKNPFQEKKSKFSPEEKKAVDKEET